MLRIILGCTPNNNINIHPDPSDLHRFKMLTMADPNAMLIVGRKTWLSCKTRFPGRQFTVVSKSGDLGGKYTENVCISLPLAINEVYRRGFNPWIIGGGQIYNNIFEACHEEVYSGYMLYLSRYNNPTSVVNGDPVIVNLPHSLENTCLFKSHCDSHDFSIHRSEV